MSLVFFPRFSDMDVAILLLVVTSSIRASPVAIVLVIRLQIFDFFPRWLSRHFATRVLCCEWVIFCRVHGT